MLPIDREHCSTAIEKQTIAALLPVIEGGPSNSAEGMILARSAAATKLAGMKTLRIFPLGIAILLAACDSQPVLLNGSEEGVVVRYSQSSGSGAEATAAAAKFCAQYGRKAVKGDGDASTGDTFVSYSCEAR